jgi:hypothetical protein
MFGPVYNHEILKKNLVKQACIFKNLAEFLQFYWQNYICARELHTSYIINSKFYDNTFQFIVESKPYLVSHLNNQNNELSNFVIKAVVYRQNLSVVGILFVFHV